MIWTRYCTGFYEYQCVRYSMVFKTMIINHGRWQWRYVVVAVATAIANHLNKLKLYIRVVCNLHHHLLCGYSHHHYNWDHGGCCAQLVGWFEFLILWVEISMCNIKVLSVTLGEFTSFINLVIILIFYCLSCKSIKCGDSFVFMVRIETTTGWMVRISNIMGWNSNV